MIAGTGDSRLELRSLEAGIVLFDGICNLCTCSVIFILQRDPHARFKFASLQSPAGARLLRSCGLPQDLSESIIYIEDGHPYTKSTAAPRIVRNLSSAWPLLYVARLVPAWIRDGIYNWVARNRYAIFGKRDACLVPSQELVSRFL